MTIPVKILEKFISNTVFVLVKGTQNLTNPVYIIFKRISHDHFGEDIRMEKNIENM